LPAPPRALPTPRALANSPPHLRTLAAPLLPATAWRKRAEVEELEGERTGQGHGMGREGGGKEGEKWRGQSTSARHSTHEVAVAHHLCLDLLVRPGVSLRVSGFGFRV